jgi:hypothetical protein
LHHPEKLRREHDELPLPGVQWIAWVDLGESGSDFYNTLSADQVRTIKVDSNYPQVQVVGCECLGRGLPGVLRDVRNQRKRASGGSYTILPI